MSKVKKAQVSVDGTVITYAFSHGEELSVNVADLPNGMKAAGLIHGIKQKVGDSYAGAKTPQEAMERAAAVVTALLEDKWTSRVAGEGGARVTKLAKALSMATGKTLEEAIEAVSGMTDETKKELGKHPKIKAAVAKIDAEAAAAAAEQAEKELAEGGVADIGAMLDAAPEPEEATAGE